MKKRILLGLLPAYMLAFSCEQAEITKNPNISGNEQEISASLTGVIVKETEAKSLVSDNGTFTWAESDKISVYTSAGTFKEFTLDPNDAGNEIGTFKGTLETGEAVGTYAVSPAGNHTIAEKTLTVNLPATYGDTEIDYVPNTNALMVAEIKDGQSGALQFRHVGGVLRFLIDNVPAGTARFVFKVAERATGDFVVNFSNAEAPVIANAAGSESTVTIQFKALEKVQNNLTFYVPLPTGDYNGFTIELQDETGSTLASLTSDKVQQMRRNGLARLPWMIVNGDKIVSNKTATEYAEIANTYIVKTPGIYSISAAALDNSIFTDAGAATWLFKTKKNLFSYVNYRDGKIYFKVDEIGGYGSLVLLNASSEIIWSYMLWCTAEAKDITIGKDVWMDRTVGAWTNNLPASDFNGGADESACGAYFQWGRKDPFPGPSTSGLSQKTRTEAAAFGEYTLQYVFNSDIATAFVVDTTDPASVANTTRYPWKYANKAIGDSNVATLWLNDSKGLHDPCPAGYKVPTAQQILDFSSTLVSWTCDESWASSNSYSRKYSKDGVEFTLINSSVRDKEGKTFNAGRAAGGWSSTYNTGNPGNAHRFYDFKKGQAIASPLGYASIAEGYPVRCVKITE